MSLHSQRILLVSALCFCVASRLLADNSVADSQSPAEILAKFAKGDPDWKTRMRSLVHLVKVGPDAVPALAEALKSGSPSQREFAAHVLAMLQHAAARPALLEAAMDRDESVDVRIHAVRGLGMLGVKLSTDQRQQLNHGFGSTSNRYQASVLALDEPPTEAKSLRRTLANYDLAKIGSARLGRLAPEFTLMGADRKTYRLSQFRGKKTVVLEFNGGFS
jgi:hypothetical protein